MTWVLGKLRRLVGTLVSARPAAGAPTPLLTRPRRRARARAPRLVVETFRCRAGFVGILRLGTIKKRVVVIEHEGEDLMAIHPVMHMALTYDHRVVDGVHANGFLYRISEILEYGDFEL